MEASSSAPGKKVVVGKGNWVNVRATMDTGVAGHVMPAGMCLHLKLTCSSMEKKFVAANGEKIQDLGEKILSQVHKECKRCEAFVLDEKIVQAGNVVVLDEKNPHIRNLRDGMIIKMDVNNGAYTMDMWVRLDETGPVFSGQEQ